MKNGNLTGVAWMAVAVACGMGSVQAAVVEGPTGAVFGKPVALKGCGEKAMALALEGNTLYAGCGQRLYVYDVTSPLKPEKVGEVDGFGAIRQVAVQKGFAYVSARESGFWIVDATDPSKPRVRSRFDCCELATGVDVAGTVAFLGQRQNGVEFIDVSDPDHPAHIAMRKTDESQSVKYRDGFLYSGDWGTGHVTVFDARDMRNIRQVAYEPLWGYGDGVWMKGKYLYCATGHHAKNRDYSTLTYKGVDTPELRKFGQVDAGSGCGHGLDIFDVTDPAAPKRVGRVDFPPFYGRGLDMWTPRTSANSDVVFCAQTHNGVFAVDCSDPTKPKFIDRWTFPLADHPEWPSCCIGSIAVGDGCLYVAGQGCGVLAIPAKGAAKETFAQGKPPLHPEFREPYPTDEKEFHVWHPAKPGQARAVAVRDDVVYAACGDVGLHVLKVKPEGGFEKIGELKGVPTVFDVKAEGDRLYTAEGLSGWAMYEIKGPSEFKEVARRQWADQQHDPALCIWKPKPGLVALSTRRSDTMFFKEEDLKAERPLVQVGGCPGWDKYLMDATVADGRWIAYNAANSYVRWIDLDAKPQPKVHSSQPKNCISLGNGICRFSERKAFVTRGSEYYFLDPGACDPADGSQWRSLKFPNKGIVGIPRVSPEGLVVLTSRIRREIALYDFKNPEEPKFLKHWKVAGNPDFAVFHRGKFIVPCGHQGVIMQK